MIHECIEMLNCLIGIVCGSGLGPIADKIENKIILDYDEIPHMSKSGQFLKAQYQKLLFDIGFRFLSPSFLYQY